ncbi:MAG: hypothetical protein IT289_10270 [Oligoflexia bacterium]|nr:hypothetical protein [Oligoflexia bacterium]
MGIDLAKSPNHHHFTRQFISLLLTKKDGESIEIIPFHFMHPWEDVKVFGPLAILIIGSSLFIGTPSPFRTQVKRFIKMLTDQVHGKSNPILVFGDSNSPDSWLNIPSYWWRKISKLAHPIFQRSPTFPAPGSSYSRKYPSMRLDQAFAINLKGNQKAEVLSMQGSDHFPLKIEVF